MWPTLRGTYESADTSVATQLSSVVTSLAAYAFVAKTLSSTREYVVESVTKIWEYSSGSLTDRTGGVAIGAFPMMAQYGDVTIAALGAGNPTAKSTGGNFSALAGAPQAEIVVVQSNAVVFFNTSTSADGWAASDVGDYTNYSTGEAASGRIITTPGAIIAAVPYGNDIIVSKRDAIYRMTYVGGVVKWQIQLIWKGMGVGGATAGLEKYQVVATARGIAFNAGDSAFNAIYLFDGASQPALLNPLTTFAGGATVILTYNPVDDVLCVAAPSTGSGAGTTPVNYYYYNFNSQTWGQGTGAAGECADGGPSVSLGIVQGDYHARGYTSSKPVHYRWSVNSNRFNRCAPSAPATSYTCYLQTSKMGQLDGKTTFDRLIPKMRRRTDLGTDSAVLTFELFTELEDTSAATTRTVTESTYRKRFDLKNGACSDTFGRFKVLWTDLDVEVDDFIVKAKFVPDGN